MLGVEVTFLILKPENRGLKFLFDHSIYDLYRDSAHLRSRTCSQIHVLVFIWPYFGLYSTKLFYKNYFMKGNPNFYICSCCEQMLVYDQLLCGGNFYKLEMSDMQSVVPNCRRPWYNSYQGHDSGFFHTKLYEVLSSIISISSLYTVIWFLFTQKYPTIPLHRLPI